MPFVVAKIIAEILFSEDLGPQVHSCRFDVKLCVEILCFLLPSIYGPSDRLPLYQTKLAYKAFI